MSLRDLVQRIKLAKATKVEANDAAEVIKLFGEMMKGEKGDRGEKGEKGDSITGPQGERGEKGEKGDTIVGPEGPRGERGPQGFKGEDAPAIDEQGIVTRLMADLTASLTAQVARLFNKSEQKIMSNVKKEMARLSSVVTGGGRSTGAQHIHVGPTAPTNPNINDLWVDTSDS